MKIGLPDLITDNLDVAKSLYESLQPIRLASEALGRRDATYFAVCGRKHEFHVHIQNSRNVTPKLADAITRQINQQLTASEKGRNSSEVSSRPLFVTSSGVRKVI